MGKNTHDPFIYWKWGIILLALAVIVLSALRMLGVLGPWTAFVVILLASAMCASSAILCFTKNLKILGYLSSIVSAFLLVLLVVRLAIWIL